MTNHSLPLPAPPISLAQPCRAVKFWLFAFLSLASPGRLPSPAQEGNEARMGILKRCIHLHDTSSLPCSVLKGSAQDWVDGLEHYPLRCCQGCTWSCDCTEMTSRRL
ncbi:hypothetical protein BKA64DRAFT_95597 [Cadophora sp. MPI-SDFR-AT-0126]|nr:hypothetical protein BKA64DRAFT_95597 [Leotiomycetes sp. MPI-SDFR-AT-0126]